MSNLVITSTRRFVLRWPQLPPRLKQAGIAWLLPLALLATWSVASQREIVSAQILPAPQIVAETFIDLARSGDIFRNGAISFARVLAGFVLGAALGLVLGTAMGLSRRIEEYVAPLWNAFAQVPVLGWLPLFMMVLGIGEALKVALLMTAVAVPLAINTTSGIRAVPASYIEVARALRFSRVQLLRRVILPASVPAILTGVRQGLTQAWLALVTVELLASSEGLGFLIVWGRQLFQLDLVLVAIVIVGAVGLLIDRGFSRAEAWLMPWRRQVA